MNILNPQTYRNVKRMGPKRSLWRRLLGVGLLLVLAYATKANATDGAQREDVHQKDEPNKPPLWQTALKQMKEKGNYVAGRVETELNVFDGDENLLGTISEVERMERNEGKIRWVTHSKKKSGRPGMVIKADFGLQDNPASALEGYDVWRSLGSRKFEGDYIEVWEGVTRANPANTITAYIDVESGYLRKAEFTMPFKTPVGSILVKSTMTCFRSVDNVWLPSQMIMDQSGKLLFLKRHLHMVKTYKDWEPRAGKNLPAMTRVTTNK